MTVRIGDYLYIDIYLQYTKTANLGMSTGALLILTAEDLIAALRLLNGRVSESPVTLTPSGVCICKDLQLGNKAARGPHHWDVCPMYSDTPTPGLLDPLGPLCGPQDCKLLLGHDGPHSWEPIPTPAREEGEPTINRQELFAIWHAAKSDLFSSFGEEFDKLVKNRAAEPTVASPFPVEAQGECEHKWPPRFGSYAGQLRACIKCGFEERLRWMPVEEESTHAGE